MWLAPGGVPGFATGRATAAADRPDRARMRFVVAVSLPVAFAMQRVGALAPLGLAMCNYAIARSLIARPRAASAAAWTFNTAVVFAMRATAVSHALGGRLAPGALWAWKDTLRFGALRGVSYVVDLAREEAVTRPSLLECLAYHFYLPLYLTGPLLPFAQWRAQIRAGDLGGWRGAGAGASVAASRTARGAVAAAALGVPRARAARVRRARGRPARLALPRDDGGARARAARARVGARRQVRADGIRVGALVAARLGVPRVGRARRRADAPDARQARVRMRRRRRLRAPLEPADARVARLARRRAAERRHVARAQAARGALTFAPTLWHDGSADWLWWGAQCFALIALETAAAALVRRGGRRAAAAARARRARAPWGRVATMFTFSRVKLRAGRASALYAHMLFATPEAVSAALAGAAFVGALHARSRARAEAPRRRRPPRALATRWRRRRPAKSRPRGSTMPRRVLESAHERHKVSGERQPEQAEAGLRLGIAEGLAKRLARLGLPRVATCSARCWQASCSALASGKGLNDVKAEYSGAQADDVNSCGKGLNYSVSGVSTRSARKSPGTAGS